MCDRIRKLLKLKRVLLSGSAFTASRRSCQLVVGELLVLSVKGKDKVS